jgi:hypothetical protein
MFAGMARHGGKIAAGVVGAAGVNAAHNVHQQQQVLSGKVAPKPGSRLEAIAQTQHFPEGTTGYGVHPNIRAIHAAAGSFGEAEIGNYFSSPDTQAEMAKPIGSSSNKTVAQGEFDYWKKVYSKPSGAGELIGGYAGSSVSPDQRAFIQQKAHDLRKYAGGLGKSSGT